MLKHLCSCTFILGSKSPDCAFSLIAILLSVVVADNSPAIETLINGFIYTMLELSESKNILCQLIWMEPGNALARVEWMYIVQTRRSLGHHLLHPLNVMLSVLCAPADFEAQSSLL